MKYDRKAIISYLWDKQVKLIRYPRERALAGATVMVAILLTTIHVVNNQ